MRDVILELVRRKIRPNEVSPECVAIVSDKEGVVYIVKDGVATPIGGGSGGGSVWTAGSGAPADDLGKNGDFYLNSDNGDVYQKEAGSYTLVSNIKGADGAPGTDGVDGVDGVDGADGADGSGSVWRVGSGAPSNGLGIDGDFYLNADNGDVYVKAGGVYSAQANIKGSAGTIGGRADVSLVTTSLAHNADWTGVFVNIGKTAVPHKITLSSAAWIRIYKSAAYMAADASRSIEEAPTGEHGVIYEFNLAASNLNWDINPMQPMSNVDLSADYYTRITNKSGATTAITATLNRSVLET